MPMRPRSGRLFKHRHMKSCLSSSGDGVLKLKTCVVLGSSPRSTCLMALSLPAPSIA